jgi:hypothetical protein
LRAPSEPHRPRDPISRARGHIASVYPNAPANLGQTTPTCPPQRGEIEIEQINLPGSGRQPPQREIVTVAGT